MKKKNSTDEATLDALLLPLLDERMPDEAKKHLLAQMCMDGERGDRLVKSLLSAASTGRGEALAAARAQEFAALIEEMKAGPLRAGDFLQTVNTGGPIPRALVVLPDGQNVYAVLADPKLSDGLKCGDPVLLDAQARVVLYPDAQQSAVGEEAVLQRRIGRDRVEVTIRDHEKVVMRVSESLAQQLDEGAVAAGAKLIVCTRRQMAFEAVPAADGLAHFRYLLRDPVPEVIAAKHIGSPPALIEELADHVRMEMLTPELGRTYGLRRCSTRLLVGVSGSGKTLAVQATWRRIYEVMSEVTGVPIGALPPRVLRLRPAKVYSKWLGESDKHLDLFFDEIEALSDERFIGADGTAYELPVVAICEEVESLARTRGEGDPIYDRIQTTALERLDANWRTMKNRLVIYLFTSNLPQHIDMAFLRRAGGVIDYFGRLSRTSFLAVLQKHLNGRPVHCDRGGPNAPAGDATRRVAREVADWLYSPNGSDPGQVEITFAGSTTPVVKYRRDLMTGSLVDQAVQQAAAEACRAHRLGHDDRGLTAALIQSAVARQVRALVNQLRPHNVGHYITLPDAERVVQVRRLDQPTVLPAELERAS
jgi:SpoVK/Ycf46/Vps4 family AAA+-type ATPase